MGTSEWGTSWEFRGDGIIRPLRAPESRLEAAWWQQRGAGRMALHVYRMVIHLQTAPDTDCLLLMTATVCGDVCGCSVGSPFPICSLLFSQSYKWEEDF